MNNDHFGFLSIRLLMLTAFYDFLSYGGGIFIPHPRKQCENYLIDLKFGNIINGIRLLRMQNFRKFALTVSLILKIGGNWSKIRYRK